MEILITICGRGGSKGIPGKNIRLLNNKPLIAYSIDHAKKFSETYFCDISLSTDNEEIKQVAERYGLTTDYVRPAELGNDIVGKVDVINHLLNHEQITRGKEYEYIIDLDISAPLRTSEDLLDGFKQLVEDQQAYNLFSVSTASRNPYFNMVERKANGYFNLVKEKTGLITSRQTAPQVYDMNASFYIYRQKFFKDGNKSTITERSLIYLMNHISFDLDHEVDFEFLEFLLREGKLGFTI